MAAGPAGAKRPPTAGQRKADIPCCVGGARNLPFEPRWRTVVVADDAEDGRADDGDDNDGAAGADAGACGDDDGSDAAADYAADDGQDSGAPKLVINS